jgi:hypothetical protein
MIVLRPTRKALKVLGLALDDSVAPVTTSKLGDWHINIVSTVAGDLFAFVSSATLLAVAVPVGETQVIQLFANRVANLLSMIGIPDLVIMSESRHYRQVHFAKSYDRRLQGSANEAAFQLQVLAEEARGAQRLSLSKAERYLAHLIHSPLRYRSPAEVAFELLASNGQISSG